MRLTRPIASQVMSDIIAREILNEMDRPKVFIVSDPVSQVTWTMPWDLRLYQFLRRWRLCPRIPAVEWAVARHVPRLMRSYTLPEPSTRAVKFRRYSPPTAGAGDANH